MLPMALFAEEICTIDLNSTGRRPVLVNVGPLRPLRRRVRHATPALRLRRRARRMGALEVFVLFWGQHRVSDPPGFPHLQAISRHPGVVDRRYLAGVWSEATGRPVDDMGYYIALSAWRLAAIVEGAYGLYVQGKVDTPYAAGLEHDVPALLQEAERAAKGDW